jgi:RHS repeat-associated protein
LLPGTSTILFGKLIRQWGSMANANEMQFSSMPRDNRSSLSFYPFRAYEPNFQRWLNQDPIQEWGRINLYRFNLNNPLSLIDPLGFAGGEEDDNEVDPDEIRKKEQQFDDNWGIPRAPTTSPSGLAFEPIPQPSQPETEEQFDENLLKNPISSLAGKEREEEAADPTYDEVEAALDIYDRLEEGDRLVLVPKPK